MVTRFLRDHVPAVLNLGINTNLSAVSRKRACKKGEEGLPYQSIVFCSFAISHSVILPKNVAHW